MRWTSDKILQMAQRMEARPNGFRVSAETAEIVVAAIRAYAREHACGPMQSGFTIEVWNKTDNSIAEHVAKIGLHEVAVAAFRATCAARPDRLVTMRQGIRVVRSSERER